MSMSTKYASRVAVIGGIWKLDNALRERATASAQLLGRALAEAGCRLVVYFSNDNSVEPYVVRGYCAALKGPPPKNAICIRYSNAQRGEVHFPEEDQFPDLFATRLFPVDDWEAPFYQSLSEDDGVDAVVLMAGATSTLIAGQIALARRLPVLAVNAYGGSGSKIWNQLALSDRAHDETSWQDAKAVHLVERLVRQCAERARLLDD